MVEKMAVCLLILGIDSVSVCISEDDGNIFCTAHITDLDRQPF